MLPPSDDELHHGFLWRAACDLPGRGRIGIYNRSYYEEVLTTWVHPRRLKEEGLSAGAALWA
jgi:polyphosphate kinase 2 (PPK2 family)